MAVLTTFQMPVYILSMALETLDGAFEDWYIGPLKITANFR